MDPFLANYHSITPRATRDAWEDKTRSSASVDSLVMHVVAKLLYGQKLKIGLDFEVVYKASKVVAIYSRDIKTDYGKMIQVMMYEASSPGLSIIMWA